MKILYYSWDECCGTDLYQSLISAGHEVVLMNDRVQDRLHGPGFSELLKQRLKEDAFDCIITFDFFPVISNTAKKFGIKYISWCFDCSHITMYTDSIFNNCNYIFSFDKMDVLKLKKYGVTHVFHLPLAVNTKRINQMFSGDSHEKHDYKYIVSFMGRLYNDQYNFYDQIKNIPEYYRGYFDAIMRSQMNIYGYDLVSELITNEAYKEIASFISFQLDKEIFITERELFISFLHKKISSLDRLEILQMISEVYPTSYFGPKEDPALTKVDFRGYLEYMHDMPHMFHDSKINLNISLRSIISGIPLKCLDIMGAGGFLISNYQPELAEYFINGKELVLYESRMDLMDKIEYYLAHEEEREEIARQGKQKIDAEFSFDTALNKIFDIVFQTTAPPSTPNI